LETRYFDVYLDLSRYSLLGKTESLEEEMKSILAQFEYCNTVKEFDTKGTPFCTYMYVPEVHPETGEVFYEREDDAHLLKVVLLLTNDVI